MRQGEYDEISASAKQLYEELKDRKWLDRGKFYIFISSIIFYIKYFTKMTITFF